MDKTKLINEDAQWAFAKLNVMSQNTEFTDLLCTLILQLTDIGTADLKPIKKELWTVWQWI